MVRSCWLSMSYLLSSRDCKCSQSALALVFNLSTSKWSILSGLRRSARIFFLRSRSVPRPFLRSENMNYQLVRTSKRCLARTMPRKRDGEKSYLFLVLAWRWGQQGRPSFFRLLRHAWLLLEPFSFLFRYERVQDGLFLPKISHLRFTCFADMISEISYNFEHLYLVLSRLSS